MLSRTAPNILFQKKTLSPGKVGSFAPSGSGSLDVSDINNEKTFQECLIQGAMREFREETCWDVVIEDAIYQSNNMIVEPLGMSIDLTRGMVTDFFFIAKTEYSIHNYFKNVSKCKKIDNFELDNNSFGILRVDTSNKKLYFKCDEANEEFKSGLKTSAMLEISLEFLKDYLIESNAN